MKTVLNSRGHHYMARVGIFLIIVALVVGMAGCVGDGDGGVTYTLTLTIASTAGGSVTTPEEGTFTYDEGEEVNLVATPDAGYQFVNWTGDVGTIADVNDATTTITMDGDYSITANFVAVAVYNLTISSTAGGNVTTPGEAGPYTYNEGTKVNLVGLPDACCKFVNWTGDTGTIADVNDATTTITMNDDYDITANFEEETVTFADSNLEASVREAIGKPTGPIYPSDLDGLTSLYVQEKNITDLTGLECCTSLKELNLYNNQISDISPLASLTSLTSLTLKSNQISDISPLASLTSLTRLALCWNQIRDISALANLTSLTSLKLRGNRVSDISPLANLTSLTTLNLATNQISDISPLANLTNLWFLYLRSNQISDIEPLVDNPGFSEGDTVDLGYNPLSDTSINTYIPQLRARGVDVDY